MRAAAAVLLLLAAACAPRPRAVAPAAEPGFLYGFLVVPPELGTPTCVAVIDADRERVVGGRHGCAATAPDGLFWLEDLRPARWVVDGFQAGGSFHRLPAAAPFAVAPAELHGWGVRRVEPVAAAPAGPAALAPAARPGEAEVLKELLGQRGISPRWRERLAARLEAVERR